jgi:hypothetical protein
VRLLDSEFVDWSDVYMEGGVSFFAITRSILGQGLRAQDHFELEITGLGIGSANYMTGYGDDFRDGFSMIHQPIRRLRFEARLTAAGLEIHAEADLSDFIPDVIEEHRRKMNSTLEPRDGFTLQMTVPWALLKLEGFRFASRAEHFR